MFNKNWLASDNVLVRYLNVMRYRGVARNLFRRGQNRGTGDRIKSPSGVQGQSRGGGLGAKPQKLNIYIYIC